MMLYGHISRMALYGDTLPDTSHNGRPTKYRSDYARQAFEVTNRFGATDEDLAAILGVSISTLNLWKRKHRKFSESIVRGKEIIDQKVERALYNRAIGYVIRETVRHIIDGKVIKTVLEKQFPADTRACIFWLKNRCPERWRDQPIEVNREVNLPRQLEDALLKIYGTEEPKQLADATPVIDLS